MQDEVENVSRGVKEKSFLYTTVAEQAPCLMTSKLAYCSIVRTRKNMREYDVEALASAAGRHVHGDDVKKLSLRKPCGYADVCLDAIG
jgi:hypothetical protein